MNGGVITNGVGGGAAISNSGAIGALDNSGAIAGQGGADAIYSSGSNASIGSIANSGGIFGNVEIDNQPGLTVTGGSGPTFGVWTGGTITIGNGNLTFAGGNTTLVDNIIVNGGSGTVFNNDPLEIAAPLTIRGNYSQSSTGVLDFLVAGDLPGDYGSLGITGSATLAGGFALELINGFTLATDDVFNLLTLPYFSLTGDFSDFSLDGAACAAQSADVWRCGAVTFDELVGANFLDLEVVSTSASLEASFVPYSAVPEPSTWAMLATGFLGLGGLGLRRRGWRALPASES